MALSETEKRYFDTCTQDILLSDEVRKMDSYFQHLGISRLDHSISVAFCSFRLSVLLGLSVDRKSLIRGAMLHDFFLYDWREQTGRKGRMMHGFTHPREALNTAQEHFELSDTERDIILRHMWPLTIVPPSCREAFIVSVADKICTVRELLRLRGKRSRVAVGV